MIKGFKDFLLRGNVVDLAVAVVIGVAFGAVVSCLRRPTSSAASSGPSAEARLRRARLRGQRQQDHHRVDHQRADLLRDRGGRGLFFVVVPVNQLMERRKSGEEPEVEAPSETSFCCRRSATCCARSARSGDRSRTARPPPATSAAASRGAGARRRPPSSGCSPQPRSVSSVVCSGSTATSAVCHRARTLLTPWRG